MRYLVLIRRTGTGYSVDVPDLPGCVATGSTVEHARQTIAEAIEMHLELMTQSGLAPPTPSTSYHFAVSDEAGEEFCTWVEADEWRVAAGSQAELSQQSDVR
jgi:predicted RNase H-like HicB family nuclease